MLRGKTTTAIFKSILNQPRTFHTSITPRMSSHSDKMALLKDLAFLLDHHPNKDSLDPHRLKRIKNHLEELRDHRKKEVDNLTNHLQEDFDNLQKQMHTLCKEVEKIHDHLKQHEYSIIINKIYDLHDKAEESSADLYKLTHTLKEDFLHNSSIEEGIKERLHGRKKS